MSNTNPAYAHLAYKRAVLEHVTNYLLEGYVGTDDSPPNLIDCPYVAQSDRSVPRDEVVHFIDQLRISTARVEDEMNRFDFVRREDAGLYDPELDAILQPGRRGAGQGQPPAAQGAEGSGQKGRDSSRRGRRKGRRSP